MSSFSGSSYYWFAVLVMAVISISIWCWKCHKQGQEREQMLARNRHLLQQQMLQQILQQQEQQPSNYRPDAPPAYDDVINKPDDYPVHYEGSTSTPLPSSPANNSSDFNEGQPLPSYQDAVHLSDHFTEETLEVSPEQINIAELGQRTIAQDTSSA